MTGSPLLLVDGSNFLHRAYQALPPLSNAAGEPTGAVFGVVNMLHKLIQTYRPASMAVVFDAPGRTFRDDLFDEYKAHRPPLPDDLAAQIPPLYELIEALGLPMILESGVEADDVIGTLARRAAAEGRDVVIATGDKDMAQLVDRHITLVDTMKDRTLDASGVKDRYGVTPVQIADYLALIGDKSDNIPGVAGVGDKTAARWLAQYESLDNLIQHADEIKGKVGERLRESLTALPLYRDLTTIRCELDLSLDCRRRPPDRERLRLLYQRFEFRNLLRQLDSLDDETAAGEMSPERRDRPERRYHTVTTEADLDAWLARLATAPLTAFDTETDTLNYMRSRIVGVSFAVASDEAAYVPLAHDYPGAPDQLDRDAVLEKLRPFLEDPARPKVGQHLKFDAHALHNHGITLRGIQHDTMLASYVLNSTATRHDMDSLASFYLGEQTVHFEDIAGRGAKMLTFNQIPLEQAAPYAAEDADVTLRLHHCLWGKLQQHDRLARLYQEIEIPLIPVLTGMERRGVRVDVAELRRQSGEIARRLQELETAAHEAAGQPFNLGSTKQLQQILYEKQGLPVRRKTPKGQPSTAEDVLAELALEFELPRLIMEHRGLSKLRSTYLERLPGEVNSDTGRVHTSYHQAVTSTGRLSSSDPNLQNIPVRTAEGRRIRRAFVAEPGYRVLAADYSQIELRIMAHLSGDAGLLRAFETGEDIHRATAAEIFGLAPLEVSGDQRRSAKAINFGLIYGMSAFGLARQLGIGRDTAQDYVERYFERYPGVRAFMDDTRERAAREGYVETVFGRRLYLPEINARNHQRRQAAERTAINAPMQGTAADIIKRAMLAVEETFGDDHRVRMIMQVHDELVFEVAEDHLEAAKQAIRAHMVAAGTDAIEVPLEVEVGIGANWDEAH